MRALYLLPDLVMRSLCAIQAKRIEEMFRGAHRIHEKHDFRHHEWSPKYTGQARTEEHDVTGKATRLGVVDSSCSFFADLGQLHIDEVDVCAQS
jgi:hypothetical protein